MHTKVRHRVPRIYVLRPIIFTFFTFFREYYLETHINVNCCADDTQLYLSMKPDQSNQLTEDTQAWMTCNFMPLNPEKTEVIVLGPKHLRNTLSNDITTLDGITLVSSTTMRNLVVIFDQYISFNFHMNVSHK